MIGTITSGDNQVLIHGLEFQRLRDIEERAQMKLRQLTEGLDDFGGFGTGDDTGNREAYIKCLSWLLGELAIPQT